MTETTSKLTVQGGSWEILTNLAGARLLDANLRWLGRADLHDRRRSISRERSSARRRFRKRAWTRAIKPLENQEMEGGSTDVGDVSWVAPTLHVTVATSPKDAPWHAWPVVATGGMSIGHKGMLRAAKTLAATMVDLYEQPAALKASAR